MFSFKKIYYNRLANSLTSKGLKFYENVEAFMFFVFLIGVLSFGRAFSIIHFNTRWAPVFITEIFLALSVPFIVFHGREFIKLRKRFLVPFLIFFSLGWVYFGGGLLKGNSFVLRDSILFIYMMFCPLMLMVLENRRRVTLFLCTLIIGNLVGLFMGRCLLLEMYTSGAVQFFISNTRTFNLGLYYGISIAFMIAFWDMLKSWISKSFVLLLISVNLYMIMMFAVRTVWVALMALFLCFFIILRKKMIRLVLCLIPAFIVVGAGLFYCDFSVIKSSLKVEKVLKKAESSVVFVNREINQRLKTVPEIPPVLKEDQQLEIGIANIVWRKKIWRQAIVFGMERPLLGMGFGVYPQYDIWGYQPPRGIGADSKVVPVHNHLITIFYKMGFVGLGLFLFINGYAFWYGVTYIKKCRDELIRRFLIGALGAFVYWHTMALAFDVIDSPPTSIFLWIIMGMIFAGISLDEKNRINSIG